VSVVDDIDPTASGLQGLMEPHPNARRVRVVGVLHQLDDGDDLRRDELVSERSHDASTGTEGVRALFSGAWCDCHGLGILRMLAP